MFDYETDCKRIGVLIRYYHFDIEDAKQLHLIDGRKDIVNGIFGRQIVPRIQTGKYFSTIAYSFDGLTLLAAGNNNSIACMILKTRVLLEIHCFGKYVIGWYFGFEQ